MENLNVVGYITSEPFSDGFVSHQIQNSTIRSYIAQNQKNLLLSWTEYVGKSNIVFDSLQIENFYQGICFYSMDQLWQMKNPFEVLETLRKRNIWIGFAKESAAFTASVGYREVLKLFWLKTQVEQNQRSLSWGI